MKKHEYVQALRELANFVESHDFPDHMRSCYGSSQHDSFSKPELHFWSYDKVDFGNICRALGSFEKSRSDYSTGANKTLSNGATISVSASREVVCKKVIVGTRIVPAKEQEIVEAEPEHEEDIVKWECPDSFVALADQNSNINQEEN